MKKTYILLIILIIIAWIIVLISCKTRKFSTRFFEISTINPELIIDSISKSDSIDIPINYNNGWSKSLYFTNDSVITSQYVYVTYKEDTTYILSITKLENSNVSYIKFRKE